MAITSRGAIAPHRLRPQRSGGWWAGDFVVSRGMPRQRQGKKVDGPPLRSSDRGVADHRPDQPIRGRVEREPVTDYEETWRRSVLMGRSDYGGARKDVPLRINGGKSRAATAGPDVASRRADGRLRVTEKGMWPHAVSSRRPRTWRDRDRE